MADINQLKPIVKQKCEQLMDKVKAECGFEIIITSTLRSFNEQHKLFIQGRDENGNVIGPIVTKADAGLSYHNYGLAFDFVPVVNGKPNWDNLDNFKKVGAVAESLGLEWGGSWTTFVDMPHIQYVLEYRGRSAKDFYHDYLDNKINWSEWDLPTPPTPVVTPASILPIGLQSSDGTGNLSTTILGSITAFVPLIIMIFKNLGYTVTSDQIATIGQSIIAVMSMLIVIWGVIKKIKNSK